MPRGSINLTPGFIILPQDVSSPSFGVTIIDQDGTEYDVLNSVESIQIRQSSRNSLWQCNIVAVNVNGEYTGKFHGGEDLIVRADYGAGTKIQFRGRIDDESLSVTMGGYRVRWSARSYPELIDQYETLTFIGSTIQECIQGIDDGNPDSQGNYEGGVLYKTGIVWDPDNAAITDRITNLFQEKNKWSIIRDVCEVHDYEVYVWYNENAEGSHADDTWYIRVFKSNTVQNTQENIFWGKNIDTVGNISRGESTVKNYIRITGRDDKGYPVLWSEEDTESQNRTWRKELLITDNSYKTHDSIKERAEQILEQRKDGRLTGKINVIGLEYVRPGESVNVFVPGVNLNGYIVVKELMHNISPNGWTCSVQLEEFEPTLSSILNVASVTSQAIKPHDNIFNMTVSINLPFEADNLDDNYLVAFDNCEIKGGTQGNKQVALTDKDNDGTIISKTLEVPFDVNKALLVLHDGTGENGVDDSLFELSTNGGLTYVQLPQNAFAEKTVPSGRSIKFRITLKSTERNPDPILFGAAVLMRKK